MVKMMVNKMTQEIEAKININLDEYNVKGMIESAVYYNVNQMINELKADLIKTIKDEFMTETKLKWSIEMSELDIKISNMVKEHIETQINLQIKNAEFHIKQRINTETQRSIYNMTSKFFEEAKDRMVFLEKGEVVIQKE